MNARVLLFSTLILSVQSFAGAESAPVISTITQTMRSLYSQEEARSIVKLCDLMRPQNPILNWGGSESQVSCTTMSTGLTQITAKNHLGQVSILANPGDMTLVEEHDGDYSYEYTNNKGQRLYLELTYKKYDSENKPPAGSKKEGFYTAVLSLTDNASRIRTGYHIQDIR
ncbi:MAG: hypothetical protein ACXWRE_04065 [Pseudobdellovibrionaceae bacterium]